MTHFFTQIPQPMHRTSEMNAILSVDLTSIQSLPDVVSQIKFVDTCENYVSRTHLYNWT